MHNSLFLLLASYYLLKTVREALILGEAGAEIKSYTAAGQPLVLALGAKAYAFVASRKSTESLITFVLLFFISALSTLGILSFLGVPVGILFFLCLGPFTLIVVAQFWGYAADLLTLDEGKRLFPIINVGAVLGAWIGAIFAGYLFRFLSAPTVLMIAGGGLLLHTVGYRVIDQLRTRESSGEIRGKATTRLSQEGAYQLLFSSRYYLLIAGVLLLLNVSKSNGEFLFGVFAVAQAKHAIATNIGNGLTEQQLIGVTYSQLFTLVNVAGFMIQILVVSWLFRRIGISGSLLVLPCLAAITTSAVIVDPVLAVAMVARVLENSVDYSLQNTAVHGLFLPTSPDAKYKVQAIVDTRFGDLVSAACVFLAMNRFHLTPRQFAAVNGIVIASWLALAAMLSRRYLRLTAA